MSVHTRVWWLKRGRQEGWFDGMQSISLVYVIAAFISKDVRMIEIICVIAGIVAIAWAGSKIYDSRLYDRLDKEP